METRSIAIGLVAIVVAFAAAFGMAKSGGSKTENAGAGVKAQSIKLAAPPAVTGVEVGGTLPALKAERKAPAKKKKKAASTTNTSTNSTSNAPSTNNAAPPTTNSAPPTTNSSPPAQQPSSPKPSKPAAPKPEQPAQGGGEDG
jgi:hypothetical protein